MNTVFKKLKCSGCGAIRYVAQSVRSVWCSQCVENGKFLAYFKSREEQAMAKRKAEILGQETAAAGATVSPDTVADYAGGTEPETPEPERKPVRRTGKRGRPKGSKNRRGSRS